MGEVGIQPRAQRLHPGRVMRAVNNDLQILGRKDFKARRMMYAAPRAAQRRLRNARVLAAEYLRRHNDQRRILRLIGPRKRKLKGRQLTADNGVEGNALTALFQEELR